MMIKVRLPFFIIHYIIICCGALSCFSCSTNSQKEGEETSDSDSESAAHYLPLDPLQGVWIDEDSQSPFMWVRGDSAYYSENTSMATSVRLSEDSLWLGQEGYLVQECLSGRLSLQTISGNVVTLQKSSQPEDTALFMTTAVQPVVYTEKTSRDTVTFCRSHRLHSYVTVNPTARKIVRTTYNAEGIAVNNYYFDNVIHLSVYEGKKCLFRSNFEKTDFADYVPQEFLEQSILSDITFAHTDNKGVHCYAMVCIPDGAACYMIELTVNLEGELTTTLRDY